MRRGASLLAALTLAGCQWDIVIGQQSAAVQLDVPVVSPVDAAVADARDAPAIADVSDVPRDVPIPNDRPEEPMGSLTGLALGDAFTCATRSDGSAWCWGANDRGQLGRGDTNDSPRPGRVEGLTEVLAIAAGAEHACVIRRDASVWCWGANDRGQLGDGTTADRAVPVRVAGLTADALSAGGAHTCAALGEVTSCWGANDLGQLGDGTTSDRPAPTRVPGSRRGVRCGRSYTCANTSAGIDCWGANDLGQLGDGLTASRSSPSAVTGAAGFALLAVGPNHACARGPGEVVRCWGDGARGARGDGSTETLREATATDRWMGAIKMTAGEGFTCASSGFSDVRCAGRNDRGQVGDDSLTDRDAPVSLLRLTVSRADFSSLVAGRAHACTALNDGTLWCWGDNRRGQLGADYGDPLPGPERIWR